LKNEVFTLGHCTETLVPQALWGSYFFSLGEKAGYTCTSARQKYPPGGYGFTHVYTALSILRVHKREANRALEERPIRF
jgi:hypothetical protein